MSLIEYRFPLPRSMRWALSMLMLALPVIPGIAAPAETEPSPIVRIEVSPETITVGEAATMRITVLVPTWQPAPPVYPAFEVPNAITRLPADSSYPISTRIGRETWSGIVRNYQVTPLLPASFSLGGDAIRITWADPGAANRTSDVMVPEATLTARIPAGAEDIDPYLAGTRFELERSIEGDTDRLEAGDALVVRYRAVLEGMPALFIPPLAPALASELVSVYPREPDLEDGERALRMETVTIVLEHGGELLLPGRTMTWWNQAEARVEEAVIEPLLLSIAGPPPAVATEAPEARNPWLLLAVLLAAGLAGLGIRRALPGYLARRQAARAAYLASEEHAFDTLNQARTPAAFYQAAVLWLHRLDPGLSLRRFAAGYGRPELAPALDRLSASLYGSGTPPADLSVLRRALGEARGRYLAGISEAQSSRLAPLNPGGALRS